MKLIGIDFSLNYPGVCVADSSFKSFRWIACINDDKMTKKFKTLLEDVKFEFPELDFVFVPDKQKKTDIYHVTERNKLRNYDKVVRELVDSVTEQVDGDKCIYAIEGFSYGAAGNTLIDIVQATGILKKALLTSELDWANGAIDSSYVFSPSELKKSLGIKGNANKVDVFNAFLNDPIIPELKKSDLYRFAVKYKDQIFDGKKVKSPIMDMIDATLNIIHLKNMLS